MKKKTIITLSIIAVLVILVFAAISTYNTSDWRKTLVSNGATLKISINVVPI